MHDISNERDVGVIVDTRHSLSLSGRLLAKCSEGPVLVAGGSSVLAYPFVKYPDEFFIHEWYYEPDNVQSHYTKEDVAEKLHLNPNHPAFHEAGRLDNDIALTTGKPKRNRKALKAKRKAAKRRK